MNLLLCYEMLWLNFAIGTIWYSNGQFPLWAMPARIFHGSCIHHLRLDICFNEYSHHDSLQTHVIEGIGHLFWCKVIYYKVYQKIKQKYKFVPRVILNHNIRTRWLLNCRLALPKLHQTMLHCILIQSHSCYKYNFIHINSARTLWMSYTVTKSCWYIPLVATSEDLGSCSWSTLMSTTLSVSGPTSYKKVQSKRSRLISSHHGLVLWNVSHVTTVMLITC